jgi:hypothetical protein
MSAHKMQRMALALTFLVRYHKDGDEFLSHIVQVIGDETRVSFMEAETKVKAVDRHTFTKQAEKV